MGRVVELNARTLPETTDPGFEFRYMDIGSVGRGALIEEPQTLTFENAPSRARRILRPGDTIVSTVRTYLRAVMRVPDDAENLVGSTGFAVLTARPQLDSRFLSWFTQSDPFIEEIVARSVGVSYPAISPSDLARLPVPTPDLPTQRAIADFLDAETARIDALIVKKRQVLRLLKERRRSYLLKLLASSGARLRKLEWLGGVPEGWPLVQIGVVGDFYAGTTFPHSYQGQTDGDYPFIKVGDLWSDEAGTLIDGANNWIDFSNARALGGRVVPARSVLYARVGEALRLNPRRLTNQPSLVDDNVRAIHFRYGDGRYWTELLTVLDLMQLANPGPVPSVSEGQVASVRIPLAPHYEQIRIADAMEREREVRSKVFASIVEQLDRLQEHRQALITAAVTGEIGVPGTTIPRP